MGKATAWTHILAIAWATGLVVAWFGALMLVGEQPTLRDAVMVGAGVFLATLKDVAQFIWRKRPDEK